MTTDGYLSACDMALFGAEDNHMKALIYGKWNPETATVECFYDRLNKIRNRKMWNIMLKQKITKELENNAETWYNFSTNKPVLVRQRELLHLSDGPYH